MSDIINNSFKNINPKAKERVKKQINMWDSERRFEFRGLELFEGDDIIIEVVKPSITRRIGVYHRGVIKMYDGAMCIFHSGKHIDEYTPLCNYANSCIINPVKTSGF